MAAAPLPLSTPIDEVPFTAIDFESAGSMPGATDVPIQVGMAALVGSDVPKDSLFVSYLAADRPVTWAAQKVHGITTDDLADAPTMNDLWGEFRTRLGGAAVVAHGAGTEKRFLRTFPLHGFAPWVDTLTLARKAFPDLASHSLGTVSDHLNVSDETASLCPGRQWHDALFDSVASLLILREIIAKFGLEGKPLETITLK